MSGRDRLREFEREQGAEGCIETEREEATGLWRKLYSEELHVCTARTMIQAVTWEARV
jgi:hypothetical protein